MNRGDRTRTCDIQLPKLALYHLSYTPEGSKPLWIMRCSTPA